MDTTLFDEFEALLKARNELTLKMTALAPGVVEAAKSDDVPVDVDHILDQIGKGVSVDQIEVNEPLITDDRITGFKEAYVGEVRQNAARIRAVVAVAAQLALKAAGI